MKVINKAILASILAAQTVSEKTVSGNYEDYEMKMYDENRDEADPVEFYDDLDKAIEEEEEDISEEDYFELEEEDISEEDFIELFDDERDDKKDSAPVKLRGSPPSNMTNADENMIFTRSWTDYPMSENHYKDIVSNECVEYMDFNVGPIWGQVYYNQVLNEWISQNPGSDIVEAGWRSTGIWHSVYGQTSYVKFGRECPGYFKMAAPEPISCPEGSHIKDEAECITAGLALGGTLRDGKLVVGSWSHVPYYCSIQSEGDMSVHFNTREGYNDGGYSSVCAQKYN